MSAVDPTRVLDRRARCDARRPALESGGERLDYATLARRADHLAGALAASGVTPGDRVATLLGGLDFAVLAHAALRCGAVLVPLNTRLAVPELARQLEDARPALLVHGGNALEDTARTAAAAADVPACAACALGADRARLAVPAGPRDARLPSTLVYTSGTTGAAKGALLTPANFTAGAVASALQLGVLPGDRWLACLPLFHVGGLAILWRCLLAGTTAVVHGRFDAERVNAALDRDGITHVSLTATLLRRLLDVRGDAPAPVALRCVLLGGGPCPEPLLARARAQGLPVAPTYGLTEAASQVATRPPHAAPDAGLTPLLGTSVRIADAGGEPGASGEIQVRGPTVMAGYWRRPDATAAALADGWLHTGDVGHLDDAGRLVVLDRRDDLIVSGGENVYPAEVEAVLAAHPDVAEAGVAGVRDAEFGARPCAWWVARPGRPAPDADALRRYCRERLAGYKVPVAFHRVAELPRTAAGKLRRTALQLPPPGAGR